MKPASRSVAARAALAVAVLSLAAVLSSQPAPREQVGPLPGGAFLLNSGWRIQPAGKQVPLDTFPMSTALSQDGKHLLVLHGGYRPPVIGVPGPAPGRVLSSVAVPDAGFGIAFPPKSDAEPRVGY